MFGLRRRQGYPCCLCSTCCWWQQYGGGVNSTHIPRREEGQGDVAVVLCFLVHSWGHVSLEWVMWRSTRWTASLCSDVAFVWHLLDSCQGWEVVVGGWVGAQRWLVGGWRGRWGHTHQKFTLHLDLWTPNYDQIPPGIHLDSKWTSEIPGGLHGLHSTYT